MASVVTITINPALDLSTSVDHVVPVHKLRCAPPRRDPGGGGINVARVVARLGSDVTAIYPVGGITGQLLQRLVEEEGVRGKTFDAEQETRLSFTVLEGESGNEYRFVLPGPSLGDAEWRRALEELEGLPGNSGLLVASGSLPAGVPGDFYAMAARAAKERGWKAVIDTSGPALAAALREGVYLVKPNLRELRELTGQPLNDEDSWLAACRELVATRQAEVVALTLADKGALLVTREAAMRAPALPIKPTSTVGAGDSFVGAMVWALANGHALEDAFRYGMAAGSAAVIAQGTGLCDRNEVHRLYKQVELFELAGDAASPAMG